MALTAIPIVFAFLMPAAALGLGVYAVVKLTAVSRATEDTAQHLRDIAESLRVKNSNTPAE